MISHLFRFRSARALLGEFEELSRQEIYFSPPDQLNDPMEGYKDIFWSGDRVVWQNLLRHYVLCLLQTASLVFVGGPRFDGASLKSIILSVPENLPDAPIRTTYQNICAAFLAERVVQKFIATMPNRTVPVRRDELRHYLRALHPFAYRALIDELSRRGLLPKRDESKHLEETEAWAKLGDAMANSLSKQLELEPAQQELVEEMFATSEVISEQLQLNQAYSREPAPDTHHIEFLTNEFPGRYVATLDELIHVPWHVACFAANPADASMWATYGDSHRGACLKFKVGVNGQAHPTLSLNRMTGWRGSSKGGIEPIYGVVPHPFYKVAYTAAYPEIDFFRSIGRLPVPALNGFWYRGEDGETSACRTPSFDTDEWRKKYWENFQAGTTCKTAEWAHEEEYRLTLHASMLDFSDPTTRKLTYNFADLSGIIFGAKMPQEDKLKIVRIIADKCRREGRQEFEFYQSRYSRKLGGFRIVPLGLIRPFR